MGRIFNIVNFKKTYHYFKKNGFLGTYYGVKERITRPQFADYKYKDISESEQESQRQKAFEKRYRFSILVPAFETDEVYLAEMIESVIAQTYGEWELILADASETEKVKNIALKYQDERIRYIALESNEGIAANTNEGLKYTTGDYVCLLDHDDLLTPDALFEMQRAIIEGIERDGIQYPFLYSDEDKCNGDATRFYEPHFKLDFNFDLLTTNNYICHFLAMEANFIKELQFRPEYDGAQDFDLVLRAVKVLWNKDKNEITRAEELPIKHIGKVLYHWRCHESSTAANPASKLYAYEAGKRAVEDFFKPSPWEVQVEHIAHLGFYRTNYGKDLFEKRSDIGLLGGKVTDRRGLIIGGIYNKDGKCPFYGLPARFSGYMHRASLQQECYAIDIRNMVFSDKLQQEIRNILITLCEEKKRKDWQVPLLDALVHAQKKSQGYCTQGVQLSQERYWDYKMITRKEWRQISILVCEEIRAKGYSIVWDPEL